MRYWPATLAFMVLIGAVPGCIYQTSDEPELVTEARRGRTERVERLLAGGADVNASTASGETALFAAAAQGHDEVVALLLRRGADARSRSDGGETPLHAAARGRLRVSRRLIGSDAHWAEELPGHRVVVDLLVAARADVKATDTYGRTPLHLAAEWGHVEMSRLLLAKGAPVDARDDEGYTPLAEAARHNRKTVAAVLFDGGAEVSAKDRKGYTPLHRAARAGAQDVARLLIARRAALGPAEDGKTPLHEAARGAHTPTIGLLITSGADREAVDKNGDTPLNVAVAHRRFHAAHYLIVRGADVNARGVDRQPLHVAVTRLDDRGMIEMLIRKGADVNARDKRGDTPLHLAAGNGYPKTVRRHVIRLLVENGADINARNKAGRTALDIAVWIGRDDVARWLRSLGASD